MFSFFRYLFRKDILPDSKKLKDESTKSCIANILYELVMSDVLTHQ